MRGCLFRMFLRKENGINWVSSGWVTVSAPAHLPTAIKEKLDAAIKASLTDAEFIPGFGSCRFPNVRMLQGRCPGSIYNYRRFATW